MSLRKLVEGDCGGSNALVNLSSHFVQDRGLQDEGFHSFPHTDTIGSANSEQLVQEFLEETMGHSAQPFRMDTLLAEMWELEGRVGPVPAPPVAQLANNDEDVKEWAQQYLDSGKHFDEKAVPGIWTSDASSDNQDPSQEYLDLGIGPKWALEYLQRTQDSSSQEEPILGDLSNSEEYVDIKADPLVTDNEEAVSKEDSNDTKLPDSKFMKFMRQMKKGEAGETLSEKEDDSSSTSAAEHWSMEFNEGQSPESEWSRQYLAENDNFREGSADHLKKPHTEKQFQDTLWKNLTQQWDQLSKESEYDRWLDEFNDFSNTYKEYRFATYNPMSGASNALELGKEKLESGDLPSAVLCFEAAVSNEPNNAYAWQLLGTTQAENERDPQAIAALKKCINLEPSNLTALMALAVSYTNENYQNQACRALKEWLRVNPKYSDLAQAETLVESEAILGITSLLSREVHENVKQLYLKAARRNPNESFDPDVQSGLGVLFNLSGEVEMAVDCFKAALQVRPNDSRLWNRLGATLANGSRSEEAVDAYRSALQLSPGFIRARYNLGITCLHLGAHEEAAEHLLISLKQQSRGRGPQGETSESMSDSIWNTLRLVVLSLLERADLVEAIENRDLPMLCRELGVE